MVRDVINKLSKTQKITCLILILIFFWLVIISGSTLARFKNRSTLIESTSWDGSVASSYRKGDGSSSNPYIISNGSELSYFLNQLRTNNYENTYFQLNNDIILNNGLFNYSTADGITYSINDDVYYVKEYTNKYYDSSDRTGNNVGTINLFNSLNGFKGTFEGNNYRIYGLYMSDSDSDRLGLFTNLEGTVKNLYVENSVIYGGLTTGGIASNTNGATISNSMFNGYVIGKNSNLTKSIQSNISNSDVEINSSHINHTINLNSNIPIIGSNIISQTITGDYSLSESNGNEIIKINNQEVSGGTFNVNLGSSFINDILVEISNGTTGTTISFTNLKYNLTYDYAIAGGIIGYGQNTSINNTVNRGTIYGNTTAGGIVGTTTSDLSISQSYNTGIINGNYSSGGIVGIIEKSTVGVNIDKSYNSGPITSTNYGGIIGLISDSNLVNITKSFNASTANYCIGTITNATVETNKMLYTNGYAVKRGYVSGNSSSVSLSNLYSKSYDASNLELNEFISFDDLNQNSSNVWVYSNNALPILYIDDSNGSLAQIKLNGYSWNNTSRELNTIKLNSSVLFTIDNTDVLSSVKEKYYYISNSNTPLPLDEINKITSWNLYNGAVQLSGEGYHIIYSKIVTDNNTTYINSDVILIDQTQPSITISMDNNNWNSYSEELGYTYIDSAKSVSITNSDNFSNTINTKYYISNNLLTTTQLDDISDSDWTTYESSININEIGTKIIYVKSIDECGNTSYVNSGYIVYDGYTESSLFFGRDSSSYLNNYNNISSKSTVTLNYQYNTETGYVDGITHNLVSNILLPQGTSITLIDYTNNKVYKYKITTSDDLYNFTNSCSDSSCTKLATYPFSLFKEIGSASDKSFNELTYYNGSNIRENFAVVLDFSDTNIVADYENVKLFLNIYKDNVVVRPTLLSTIKEFNIYHNSDADTSLTTTNNKTINLNSDSTVNIDFNSKITYNQFNSQTIFDTKYENYKMGLLINLLDSSDRVVDKEHLKSLKFKIGEEEYFPSDDNNIYIDIGTSIANINKLLTIQTSENNDTLDDGTYTLKIQNYLSYDGKNNYILGDDEIHITVKVVRNSSNIKYSFNVIMSDDDLIIHKDSLNKDVSFSILESGNFKDPSIKVSLYEKDSLTAYNQDYSLINLSSYISNSLEESGNNTYYAIKNPVAYYAWLKRYNQFTLNLIPNNFSKNEYKYVFDLYDGTKKVGTIEKYFIVK